jgi:hypothetical protein
MTELLASPFLHILAFDNGTSANGVALLGPNNEVKYEKLPIKKELSYTKEEHHITRLDAWKLQDLLIKWNSPTHNTLAVFERPMINPMRFRASISAVRCLEAELIIVEKMGYRIQYVDSKQWQHALLPGVVGSPELKKASLELGKKLFPSIKLKKDADSLLIAYWAMHQHRLEQTKPKPKKIKKEL